MSEEIKEYVIHARVKSATGWQEFIVRAKSDEEAIEAWREGDGEFIGEEISVEDFGAVEAKENI